MAGCAHRRGRFARRLHSRGVADVGNLEGANTYSRVALHQPFLGSLGLATLSLGNAARDRRHLHRQLRASAPGRATSAGGHFTRIEFMKSELSLTCRDIERYLGEEESRVHALGGVSLDVESGSIHAVVGPSGCGKSTLLYILALLDEPDAGSVSIESEPMLHLSDDELARKRYELIGFIFQFHFLMEDFTAQENVMIPMRRLGRLSDAEMRDRAAGLLSAVGLGDKLPRPSRHLS